jgi:AmmeMemoRadiSam system protein A
MNGSELGRPLLRLARTAIGAELGLPVEGIPPDETLNRVGATFVTLTRRGELRGCVGTLEPIRPLRVDVQRNAVGAAFRDARFPPLAREEFGLTSIEVSLLTLSQPLRFADEDDLLAQLRPGIDGVTIEYGYSRATFLPQVWQALPEPRRFLAELKQKAGLPPGFWHPEMNVSRYQVTKWRESESIRVRTYE